MPPSSIHSEAHAGASSPATITAQLDDLSLLRMALGHADGQMAARLLTRFAGVDGLARASPLELARLLPVEGQRLLAALELGRRTLAAPLRRGAQLTTAAEVAALFVGRLTWQAHEELHVLGVDAQMRLQTHAIIGIGGATEVAIAPTDVFRPLVRDGAPGCIVVHNHPTGDPAPSRCDRTLTRRLRQVAELLGIRLHDHVIVGAGGYFSFNEEEAAKDA